MNQSSGRSGQYRQLGIVSTYLTNIILSYPRMSTKKVLRGGKKKKATEGADESSVLSSPSINETATTGLLSQQLEPGTGVEVSRLWSTPMS